MVFCHETLTIGKDSFKLAYSRHIKYKNNFILTIFKNNKIKPIKHLLCGNTDSLSKQIKYETDFLYFQYDQMLKRKKESCDKKIQFKNYLKENAILCCSWGWEQTNVEFYKVLSVNKNKTQAVIIELGHIIDKNYSVGDMSYHVLPDINNHLGEAISVNIRGYGIKINDSITLHEWDNESKFKSTYA